MRLLVALVVASLALSFAPPAQARHRAKPKLHPQPGARVAVQPIEGEAGRSVRGQIVRLLGRQGFRVTQSLPAVSGTAQYPGLARERGISSFVVTTLEERPRSVTATFLIWRGLEGDVADRWSVSAPLKRFPRALARGFWSHLGASLCAAKTPPSGKLPPAPTMRIDASSKYDEPIVSEAKPVRAAAP